MSLTIQKNTNITRNLTAEVEGNPVSVATFTGQVNPCKAMSMSLVITDEALAAANHADVAAALDDFLSDLRAMAVENGLPV